MLERESLNVELGVDAQWRESPFLDRPDNGVFGRATLSWEVTRRSGPAAGPATHQTNGGRTSEAPLRPSCR